MFDEVHFWFKATSNTIRPNSLLSESYEVSNAVILDVPQSMRQG